MMLREGQQSINQPWYMQLDEMKTKLQVKKEPVDLPKAAPETLIAIVNEMQNRLGLDNLIVFDMRNHEEKPVAKFSDFMILATARSPVHSQKSYILLSQFLKARYRELPTVEGKVTANWERRQNQRLRRRVNLGTSKMVKEKATESWLMVDCKVNGIFVNILTEKRRKELNLEELFAPDEEKHKYLQKERFDDPSQAQDDEDSILVGLRNIAQQKRQYCTITSVKKSSSLNVTLGELKNLTQRIHSNSALEIRNELNKLWPRLGTIEELDRNLWLKRHTLLETLLLESHSQNYSYSKYVIDYFLFKKNHGEDLTKCDMLRFLRMIRAKFNKLGNDLTTLEMTKANSAVIQAFSIYNETTDNGGNPIVYDEDVICALIDVMVINNKLKLHSFFQLIASSVLQEHATQLIVCKIIDTFLIIQKYSQVLSYWDRKTGLVNDEQDLRPWSYFIKSIIATHELSLIKRVHNEGILYWIIRNQVPLSPELKEQLACFYDMLDPKQNDTIEHRKLFGITS